MKKITLFLLALFIFSCSDDNVITPPEISIDDEDEKEVEMDDLVDETVSIEDLRIGDLTVNYVNPEISPKDNYMLWIELNTDNGFTGKVWHCGIDPATGDLIPEDGKGFSPFTSNIYARPADWGVDELGIFYIGANLEGAVKLVRPVTPTTGTVEDIAIESSNKRRVFYPSQLPNSNERFVSFIENDVINGFSSSTPQNTNFQLRLLDLKNPENNYLIKEEASAIPNPIAMDVLVPRWIKGSPYLTFGSQDANGQVQATEINAFEPANAPLIITNDAANKVDGHPIRNSDTGEQYFFSGNNGTDKANVYQRMAFGEAFTSLKEIAPVSVHLENPALNQSHEPFIFNGEVYTTFQINEEGEDFFETTFNKPGEIWMAKVSGATTEFTLLSDFDAELCVSEPEPYKGTDSVWIFYSAVDVDPDTPYLKRQFQLRRSTAIRP